MTVATRGCQHLFAPETSRFNNLTWAWWRSLPRWDGPCTACSRKCTALVVLFQLQLEESTARSASSPAKTSLAHATTTTTSAATPSSATANTHTYFCLEPNIHQSHPGSHSHVCPYCFLSAPRNPIATCVSLPWRWGSPVHGSRTQLPHSIVFVSHCRQPPTDPALRLRSALAVHRG